MILVMLSGGLDSTGVLYNLLSMTQEPIHAHHISIRNVENRWQSEQKAVSEIVTYCAKIRPFKYTTNVFGFPFKNFICWDNDVVRFLAAQIAQNDPAITQVALGKCLDDDSDGNFSGRAEQSALIWNACFHTYPNRIPKIIRPLEKQTKLQIYEGLPDELQKSVWYCRKPLLNYNKTKFIQCRQCKTCKQMIGYGLL